MLKNLKTLTILLVEDEIEIQESLKEVFEHFFAKVYTANDGFEALEVMQEKKIHTIFTDYEMPNMNGYNFIKEIRISNKSIPITIISNHDDREKLQACIPLRLCAYLFKPLTYIAIQEYLETFVKQLLEEGTFSYTFSKTHNLNLIDHVLIENNNIHKLTRMEFLFLELLISHSGKVATMEDILDYLYELEPSASTIKNIVYRLKKKYNFNYIENIPHLGYKLIHDI